MFDMSHEKSEITQMKLLYIIKIYNNLKAIMKMIFKITWFPIDSDFKNSKLGMILVFKITNLLRQVLIFLSVWCFLFRYWIMMQ